MSEPSQDPTTWQMVFTAAGTFAATLGLPKAWETIKAWWEHRRLMADGERSAERELLDSERQESQQLAQKLETTTERTLREAREREQKAWAKVRELEATIEGLQRAMYDNKTRELERALSTSQERIEELNTALSEARMTVHELRGRGGDEEEKT